MSNSRYKNPPSDQKESPFFNGMLHRDVRQICIYPAFSKKMLGMFAKTCKRAESETVFFRLLVAAVGAEPESYNQQDEAELAAIAILKRHPELLFKKGMVTDHFGRKIHGSPYQIFLGAGDVWALKQVHEDIMPHIEGGAEKAREQYVEQFPNPVCALSSFTQQDLTDLQSMAIEDQALQNKIKSLEYQNDEYKKALFEMIDFTAIYQLLSENKREDLCAKLYEANICHDDRNIAQIMQTKETLNKVVAAITADPCTNGLATLDATSAAIEELRQLFVPKEGEIIRTGLHFPIAILQEVFRVYDVQVDLWSGEQLAFFSREAIGAALAASTVVDGQSYKHGLWLMEVEKGPDRRDGLFCRYPKGIPAELAPLNNQLGRTMFVDPCHGESCFLSVTRLCCFDTYNKYGPARMGRVGGARGRAASCLRLFGKFMSNKKSELAKLICGNPKPRPEPAPSRCVIC